MKVTNDYCVSRNKAGQRQITITLTGMSDLWQIKSNGVLDGSKQNVGFHSGLHVSEDQAMQEVERCAAHVMRDHNYWHTNDKDKLHVVAPRGNEDYRIESENGDYMNYYIIGDFIVV